MSIGFTPNFLKAKAMDFAEDGIEWAKAGLAGRLLCTSFCVVGIEGIITRTLLLSRRKSQTSLWDRGAFRTIVLSVHVGGCG